MVDFFKFTEQVNLLHPTALLALKFTVEIYDNETIFLDPVEYRGTAFNTEWEKAIIDIKTHFKRKPYNIHIFTSYHPLIVKRDLTNKKPWESYEQTPLRKYFRFQKVVDGRGWPHNFERKIAIRSKTHRGKAALLKQNNKEEKEILPFVTQYKPLVSIIKETLM